MKKLVPVFILVTAMMFSGFSWKNLFGRNKETQPPETTAPMVTTEPTEPTLSPEEYHALMADTVGTLAAEKITGYKTVMHTYMDFEDDNFPEKIEDVFSFDLLPEEYAAETPEDVRFVVNYIYGRKMDGYYVSMYESGNLPDYLKDVKGGAFVRVVTLQFVDVLTDEILVEKVFEGGEPEAIVTGNGNHYGSAPDEAAILKWLPTGVLEAVAACEENAARYIDPFTRGGTSLAALTEAMFEDFDEVTMSDIDHYVEINQLSWDDQACIEAERWLAHGDGHSAKNLREIMIDISAFTKEQADYAIHNCDVDWNEQALKKAIYYLDEVKMGFSQRHLISFLVNQDGFTEKEATYASDNYKGDWNEQAVIHVRNFMNEGFTRESMIADMIERFGFTQEQAEYGVKKNGLK